MKRLVHIFKMGRWREFGPVTVFQTLGCVPHLKAGRTTAPEAEPVTSVPDLQVGWILPYLPNVVRDMVMFQRLTALRPGEVCSITPSMVNRRVKCGRFILQSIRPRIVAKAEPLG